MRALPIAMIEICVFLQPHIMSPNGTGHSISIGVVGGGGEIGCTQGDFWHKSFKVVSTRAAMNHRYLGKSDQKWLLSRYRDVFKAHQIV